MFFDLRVGCKLPVVFVLCILKMIFFYTVCRGCVRSGGVGCGVYVSLVVVTFINKCNIVCTAGVCISRMLGSDLGFSSGDRYIRLGGDVVLDRGVELGGTYGLQAVHFCAVA